MKPLSPKELEQAERLEKIYAPDAIRISNQLLIARTRLKQIDNWREQKLKELERRNDNAK